ncbi:MAG: YoaK family protein [Burkholderiales bacterium]
MPLEYLRELSGHQRQTRGNRHLGLSLAFIAGAVNAGGFLAVGHYTSHMTGLLSATADHLALGEVWMAMAALVAILTFVAGAATTALQINWAQRRQLRSQFALSLLLEAMLLLLFGLAGAYLQQMDDFFLPGTVLLLCYIMGLQNAIITKVSRAEIRTTHVTGLVTDIGIELGKMFYYNRSHDKGEPVQANRDKLFLHLKLVGCFFVGGVLGALAFKRIGYSATLPLALWLIALAVVPIWDDLRLQWWLYRHGLTQQSAAQQGNPDEE